MKNREYQRIFKVFSRVVSGTKTKPKSLENDLEWVYIFNHTNQMTLERRIHQKLNDAFSPLELKVVNFSGAHNAHAQSPNNGQSHFEIHMVSAAFKGKSRVACQKAVYQALEKEIKHIHALTMVLAPPDV